MSHQLQQHAPLLKLLSKSRHRNVTGIIKAIDSPFIDLLCECALNVLKGNVPLSRQQKRDLSKYKQQLRFLSNKKNALKKRRGLLQRGGFLKALIPPVLTLIGSLL